MAIEGTQDVLVTLRFRIPPGTDATKAASMIGQNGISITSGLLTSCKEMNVEIVPAKLIQ